MRSAIKRRSPMTLISEESAASGTAARGAVALPRSAVRILPPGPEPATVERRRPASLARRRLAGEVITRPWRAAGALCAGAAAAAGADGMGADAGAGAAFVAAAGTAATGAGAAGAGAAGAAGCAEVDAGAFAASVNSKEVSGE